ncbi:class I adenylate-forming enzyme family protein [Marinibacterium sp. SX1]|uniref:class I adenylate-forming enzyme family protein n=1 Tax=Marinibacterium sp. SX1 TaxID=3388424 RepID=UPI003D16753C
MHLTAAVHRDAREEPDRIATICGDRIQTCAALEQRVSRLAAGLRDLGLAPGDRVGMLSMNSDFYIEYIFGTLWAGGVLNPVNVRWSVKEIAFSLDDSGTAILIVDDTFAPMVPELRALSDTLTTVIHVGTGPAPEGALDYEALIAAYEPCADAMRGGNDLAAILYTGGTTGAPKGVMLSHQNMLMDALGLTAGAEHGGSAPGLHVAPLFHIGGLAVVMQFMVRRAPHVLLPTFDAGETLRLIEHWKIGDMFTVPTMLRRLIDHPDLATRDVSSLRSIRYGAAPIDQTLLRAAMKAFPSAGFLQVYGQTEAAPVVTALAPEFHTTDPDVPHMASAGRSIPTAEIAILGADDSECPRGEVGEICVRGPTVMIGYWNRPEETAQALRGGWLHTGDAGFMDDKGFVYVVDRIKDIIITGGENVFSTEVENILTRHPAVQFCAVIGVPDEEWGERVHAVLVLHAGHDATEDEMRQMCRAEIAHYKVPRSIEFRAEMPLSPAGKILKRELRDSYWQGRSRRVG